MTTDRPAASDRIRLLLTGDVMTGRGIDQILAWPSKPRLHEAYVSDAREYVHLAERAHAPIDWPVDDAYIWGDALGEIDRLHPDVRLINLETSITTSDHVWPAKEVHYRMHPRNVGCLSVAKIDCCGLANNHVMDWGYDGLLETLSTLNESGLATAGAGGNAQEAQASTAIHVPGKGRVLVSALGSDTSGIPWQWAAAADHPGIALLTDLSQDTAARVAERAQRDRRAGDVVVVSIHWGKNWGYDIPDEQRQFAHRLIESGIDCVHGHSSHHVKAIELYRNRPILYGCGDLITDYEGIGGQEAFRGDLGALYIVDLPSTNDRPAALRLVPMRMHRLQLTRPSDADVRWLRDRLDAECGRFGTHVQPDGAHLRITTV